MTNAIDIGADVLAAAGRARAAAAVLAVATRETKDAALYAMAGAIEANSAGILAANAEDVAAAASGSGESMLDRLRLTESRVAGMADGLRSVARLADPVGTLVRGSTLANGLELRQLRVPFGVVGVIYEGRPNVTADVAGLCLKSGNAALLRGSSSAAASNAAIVESLRAAVAGCGLPPDAVTLVPGAGREPTKHLMRARGLVDVLIPRGGAELIQTVVAESTVPVIETGVGNCHVYVDAGADPGMALAIVVNSKVSRPSVCNAAETLLVHRVIAPDFLPAALIALDEHGVTVHADERVRAYRPDLVTPATEADWATEYLSLDIAIKMVDSLEEAVEHIRRFGSGHTEAIVTDSQHAARRFTASVDAATIMVNASTRFTDGREFGFGAEIGISTQKLHARGPLGLPELTTSKYVVIGDGHVRV
ncbi:MAG TPA: glutamate-5-semialdehyde dehydrogenase [Actinomycetes bacterium]|nr:glutamate-5-semialdehyde dehydrogenase [Actinomycetes bacterium]